MVSARDLREVLGDLRQQAGKRAVGVLDDVKLPEIGRRNDAPALLWLSLGLALGAMIGMLVALLATPYSGDETRRRLGQQVERMRMQREREELMRAGDGEHARVMPTEVI